MASSRAGTCSNDPARAGAGDQAVLFQLGELAADSLDGHAEQYRPSRPGSAVCRSCSAGWHGEWLAAWASASSSPATLPAALRRPISSTSWRDSWRSLCARRKQGMAKFGKLRHCRFELRARKDAELAVAQRNDIVMFEGRKHLADEPGWMDQRQDAFSAARIAIRYLERAADQCGAACALVTRRKQHFAAPKNGACVRLRESVSRSSGPKAAQAARSRTGHWPQSRPVLAISRPACRAARPAPGPLRQSSR